MGSLQRTIDLYELDAEAFRAYKDRLIEYLERFIKDLTGVGGEIAELLGGLDPGGSSAAGARCAPRRRGRRAGRRRRGEDFREQAFAAELAAWQERWLGLRQWFISSARHPSQAKLLRARARKAIPDLLAVVATAQRASRRPLRPHRRLPGARRVVRPGARRGRDAPAVAGDVRRCTAPAT